MKLYNTMTRQTETLKPLTDNKVRIYTCGLTVYSQPHIGNWLGYIYWDVLVRALKAEGYTVERTQNITDVGHLTSDDDNGEDKMEKGARSEGITAWDIAKKYTEIANHEGYELLGLLRPTHLVAATSLIDKQIEFARELEQKGYLYEIPGDGMYFDTAKLSDYGKLAKLD
ncbi:class I tRNA ligase family protein, partial [Candidatus Saccharibacteria bacterium]|nr:class I tRNA ligase family protein [Candidatus Saccharibacteria bacterium]